MATFNPFASKKIVERMARQRKELWPDVTDDELWLPGPLGRVGYAAVPRTMPIIQRIMDDWSNSKPLSSTYLALWCRDMGSGVVNIGSEEEMAYESGFNGTRAAYQWKERMKLLLDLGFIDRKEGAKGAWSHILIWNPYHTIKAHKEKNTHPIPHKTWIALSSRMRDIGATDWDEPKPAATPTAPTAAPATAPEVASVPPAPPLPPT